MEFICAVFMLSCLVLIVYLRQRMPSRKSMNPCVHHEEIAEWNNPCLRCRGVK
jgi:hypothetical protein